MRGIFHLENWTFGFGKMILFFLVGLSVLMPSEKSFAETYWNVNLESGFYQNQDSISSDRVIQDSFYDLGLHLRFKAAGGKFSAGLEYFYSVFSEQTSASTGSLTASDYLASLKFDFGRNQLFSISLAGNPTVHAKYSVTGASTEDLAGSGYLGRLTLQPELNDNWRLAASIVYFMTSFSRSGSTLNRNMLFPTLSLKYLF